MFLGNKGEKKKKKKKKKHEGEKNGGREEENQHRWLLMRDGVSLTKTAT